MDAKIFKAIISAIPDNAEIMVETEPDKEWEKLKSVSIRDVPYSDDPVTVYLNYSD